MNSNLGRRGGRDASLFATTDALTVAGAAVETVLLAGLTLIATGSGPGSGVTAAFLRFNDLPLAPLRLVAGGVFPLASQFIAAVLYGLLFGLLTGLSSWYDRRQI